MSHRAGHSLPLTVMWIRGPLRNFHRQFALAGSTRLASGLLPITDVETREDVFDRLLRWVHRLLNPPRPSPASTSGGRRPRRVRDRVPI
jgi:hypothetical protein